MEHLLAKYTNALYRVKQKDGKRLRVIYLYHNNESEEIKYLRNKCRCNSSLTHGCRLLLKESRRPTLCQLLTDSRKANESERTPYNLPSTVNQIIQRWEVVSHLKFKPNKKKRKRKRKRKSKIVLTSNTHGLFRKDYEGDIPQTEM